MHPESRKKEALVSRLLFPLRKRDPDQADNHCRSHSHPLCDIESQIGGEWHTMTSLVRCKQKHLSARNFEQAQESKQKGSNSQTAVTGDEGGSRYTFPKSQKSSERTRNSLKERYTHSLPFIRLGCSVWSLECKTTSSAFFVQQD